MGFQLVNGFIDHLYPPLGTTSNYSAITNLHTLQFTTGHTKSFPVYCVSNSRTLATASNIGHSLASCTHVVTVRRISCNWTSFFTARLSAVNLTGLPSFLSFPYRVQLNCQPSTIWVPGWLLFHSPNFNWQLNSLTHQPATSLHFTSPNWTGQSQGQGQSYIITGGLPPISLSWCQAPWRLMSINFLFQLKPLWL
jgi:hypothetical protein